MAFSARSSNSLGEVSSFCIVPSVKPLISEVIIASPKNRPKPNQNILSIKSAVGFPIAIVTSTKFFIRVNQ